MPKMIGIRSDYIIHRSGHAVAFEPGVEVFIPENKDLIKACLDHGHQIVKEAATKTEPVVEAEDAPAPVVRPAVKKS